MFKGTWSIKSNFVFEICSISSTVNWFATSSAMNFSYIQRLYIHQQIMWKKCYSMLQKKKKKKKKRERKKNSESTRIKVFVRSRNENGRPTHVTCARPVHWRQTRVFSPSAFLSTASQRRGIDLLLSLSLVRVYVCVRGGLISKNRAPKITRAIPILSSVQFERWRSIGSPGRVIKLARSVHLIRPCVCARVALYLTDRPTIWPYYRLSKYEVKS